MLGVAPRGTRYRFGPFELIPDEESLARNGTPVKVQDLPYRLLVMLLERPGEIVTRDEVRQRLWPENTFVEFDNSLGVAIRKVRDSLNDDAAKPLYVETLPRRGYRFVAPVTVLSAETAGPPANPTEVRTPDTVQKRDKGPPGRRDIRGWVIAAVFVLLGAVAARFVLRRLEIEPSRSQVEARTRRSVAVLGFRNLPGRREDNWLSPALAEMLNTELAAGGGLRMISGEDVARAKRELPLYDEDSLAKSTLERLRTTLGADVVVLGSYTLLPKQGENRIRLDVRLQDTLHGEMIAEQSLSGSEDDLFELANNAGSDLRASLGISPVSVEAINAARAALPANERAARLYAQGRAKLWAYDFVNARDLLVKAIAEDPNYSLSHSALSEALWHMGFEAKARGEAQRATELDASLSQEQRLLLEGQYRKTLHQYPKVVEAYQSLFDLFPDSLDYGLLLASAQMVIKPSDSLRTLALLRSLPPPSNQDARIDMVEAAAWINVDDTKARAAAKRAIDKASAQGSHVIVARTYGFLCQQAGAAGPSQEAIGECENALQSSLAAKDDNGAAIMRNNLASLYFQRGDLAQSGKMFREAIAEFRRVGNEGGAATSLANFGALRIAEGDLSEAKKLIQESMVEYQAVEDKEGIALSLNNLGDLLRQSGNLQTAATTYQQAKATALEIDDKSAIAYVLQGLGDVAVDRGDLGAARKSYEEALALRNQTGEKQFSMESQLSLARVSVEEGKAAEVEASVRELKEEFRRDKAADDELEAVTVLVQALLAEGKVADAQKEIDASQSLVQKNQSRLLILQFEQVAAADVLASDHPESTRSRLQGILKEARAHDFVSVALGTELEFARLEKKSGHTTAARAELVILERTAREKGFGLIAGKAQSARNNDDKRTQ